MNEMTEARARWICCPMCDKKKCDRSANDCDVKLYLENKVKNEGMMQIVINIPEKLACEGFERSFTEEEKNILIRAIGNGTPLPKGHGKLKDENEIFECIRNRVENLKNDSQFIKYRKDIDLLGTIPHIRNEVRTIIEADKE